MVQFPLCKVRVMMFLTPVNYDLGWARVQHMALMPSPYHSDALEGASRAIWSKLQFSMNYSIQMWPLDLLGYHAPGLQTC